MKKTLVFLSLVSLISFGVSTTSRATAAQESAVASPTGYVQGYNDGQYWVMNHPGESINAELERADFAIEEANQTGNSQQLHYWVGYRDGLYSLTTTGQ